MKHILLFSLISVAALLTLSESAMAECGECSEGHCLLGCPIDDLTACGPCNDDDGACVAITGGGCGTSLQATLNPDGTVDAPSYVKALAKGLARGLDDERAALLLEVSDNVTETIVKRRCDGAVLHRVASINGVDHIRAESRSFVL
ncbi:MAG: hypothetical protein LC667_12955 [Thioalkalivibrio sp.]|nr:hypothetical protein [Thioalkalivibrio sp.]